MRKITEQAVRAFFAQRKFKSGNTKVIVGSSYGQMKMYLHNNLIAEMSAHNSGKTITLYDCGWQTVTTKERLNGILDRIDAPRISQYRGIWYSGGSIEWQTGLILQLNENNVLTR